MKHSKPLRNPDISGFNFMQEVMAGEPGAAINFDCLLRKSDGTYLIFELLLCEEYQTVDPWTSHPNRYWHKNSLKFISLWNAAQAMGAQLWLVNYAKAGTKHEDKVKCMHVINCTKEGIQTEDYNMSRQQFSEYFRKLNNDILMGR